MVRLRCWPSWTAWREYLRPHRTRRALLSAKTGSVRTAPERWEYRPLSRLTSQLQSVSRISGGLTIRRPCRDYGVTGPGTAHWENRAWSSVPQSLGRPGQVGGCRTNGRPVYQHAAIAGRPNPANLFPLFLGTIHTSRREAVALNMSAWPKSKQRREGRTLRHAARDSETILWSEPLFPLWTGCASPEWKRAMRRITRSPLSSCLASVCISAARFRSCLLQSVRIAVERIGESFVELRRRERLTPQPDSLLHQFDILDSSERHQLLEGFNGVSPDLPLATLPDSSSARLH